MKPLVVPLVRKVRAWGEALSLVLRHRFAVVLLDVQMPEMDGLVATAAIRKSEKRSDFHLPIFAMTAHAMKGDRERCLAAGMDGYITKPVRFSDIEETLAGLIRENMNSSPAAAKAESWDRTQALDRIGGDEQLLRDLCQIFLEESPKLMAKLRHALAAGDCDGLMRAAHSIKGESSYLGAGRTSEAARQLEDMGRNQDLAHAGHTLAELEREISSLQDELKELTGAQL